MKEYIKKFETALLADNYAIVDIPFTTTVSGVTPQNLVCNEEGKKLVVGAGGVVTVESAEPELVDLGLSVKWMKYNLDATGGSSADDWYGNYYAWGDQPNDITGKTDYVYGWRNYKFGRSGSLTKYTGSDGKTNLTTEGDDVIRSTYGSSYRMPTKAELDELIGLTNEWVTNYNGVSGLNGCLLHGKDAMSANTLFIPAAGYCYDFGRYNVGNGGYLWSSSLKEDYADFAWELIFDVFNSSGYLDGAGRFCGCSVRGVQGV